MAKFAASTAGAHLRAGDTTDAGVTSNNHNHSTRTSSHKQMRRSLHASLHANKLQYTTKAGAYDAKCVEKQKEMERKRQLGHTAKPHDLQRHSHRRTVCRH